MKKKIIEYLHILVSHNVIGDKQLFNRYKGFQAELKFEEFIKESYSKYEILDGGMIFSIDNKESSLNNSVYLTVIDSQDKVIDYENIYKHIVNIGFKEMLLVHFDDEHWEEYPVMIFKDKTISLPIPKLTILKFDFGDKKFKKTENEITVFSDLFQDLKERKRNSYPILDATFDYLLTQLSNFSLVDITKIYVNRLFLDGFIGFGKKKGKISDIDLILKRPSGELKLIEIKEKDLAKKINGFGLDVPRLRDMLRIEKSCGLEFLLVVRHINNQTQRSLIGWKKIAISKFSKLVEKQSPTEGGTGMRSKSSKNPTLICEVQNFDKL